MTARDVQGLAQTHARTASAAYADAASYLRTVPEAEWGGPTGCARWNLRTLAGHIAGEAVWFPNLTRGITHHDAPLPNEHYEALKTLPPLPMADTIQHAAEDLTRAIAEATPDQLQEEVDLGWMSMPLGRATYVALMEAVYHNWDLHVGRDPAATIPTAWAQALATSTATLAPMLASRHGVAAAPGRYLLHVADDVGPVTMTATDENLAVEQGAIGTPDVMLHLTADQYVRLVAGRLSLDGALDQGSVTAEGDQRQALGLLRIFRGIANEG